MKNRANKVREKVLNCNNQGELVSLYLCGAITYVEVDWLKANLLSQVECDRFSGFIKTVPDA